MSQIFPKSANAWARFSLFGLLLLIVLGAWAILLLQRSDFVTAARANVQQPIQFSHLHHVGGEGFDCRYCHTSVEKSAFADIPSTKICMNCHSQIWLESPYLEPVRESFKTGQSIEWIRVHDLPDFVYFNHSIHVNKGVGCETCHGRVDEMPAMQQVASLQMEWCLDCHRRPEQYLRPRSQVTVMGYEPEGDQLEIGRRLKQEYKVLDAQTLTSCSTCHR
ncbi:MAG: cytochrome C [Luteitalea sp.]|nr:cytochrome C [Luteitalea sp.]